MAENFFGITDTGRVRANNEDTFIAEKLSNGWIVACVIDGVGGYEGGEVAAAIARETITTNLRRLAPNALQTLQESLLDANKAIYHEKTEGGGKEQMACVLTVALVDLDSNQFFYAHVGDTRLYLLRDRSLVKVTKDHSFVGFLEDSGRLTEKEAMSHPKRNEINKALGFDPQLDVKSDYIETGTSPFLPGDMLLLCSDGLTDLVDNRQMTAVLTSAASLPQKGEALVQAANEGGGKDNITVVLVHNNKKPLKLRATKPVLTKKNAPAKEEAPLKAEEVEAPPVVPSKRAGGNALAWVLGVLCLLLAAACFWLWWQNRQATEPLKDPVAYTPGVAEQRFRDSLVGAARSLQLSPASFGNNIVLGETVFIRQDTLRLNGNGITLIADSSFNGPALLISNNTRYLLLENFVFKNFPEALRLEGKGLQLRSVQFVNCKVAVQHSLGLPPDSSLNGTVKDTFIVARNSLPK